MIPVDKFISTISSFGVDFFCGVPDSLLKSFCAYLTDHREINHVITANEGGAVGLAAGHYLATGKMACVYMQNSGQGNAINPLASLADPDVYSIPMLLLVGWRGEPGVHDEPQHVRQGKITIPLFEAMGMPVALLTEDTYCNCRGLCADLWQKTVEKLIHLAMTEKRPVALVVRKCLFGDYVLQNSIPDISPLRREDVIRTIVETISPESVVVSTTGMISREVYEMRNRLGQTHSKDFLTVGSMGHALMIALGVARDCNVGNSNRYVVCLDGDGASIMHMGNMAIAGAARQANLIHIVLNNAAHDSVGGQPTVGGRIDFCKIADACGYHVAACVEGDTVENLKLLLRERIDQAIYSRACDPEGDHRTTFIEIKVAKGAREDIGRPKESTLANKTLFMQTLGVE